MSAPDFRVGLGFDVHPFSDDPRRLLVLGGVTLAGERGLAGHRDADAVTHAVADGLLGAAGLGDLGSRFPDTDPAWAGADSLRLLASVVEAVRADGWAPANVDCAVVLDAPRLAPHVQQMEATLSGVVSPEVHDAALDLATDTRGVRRVRDTLRDKGRWNRPTRRQDAPT